MDIECMEGGWGVVVFLSETRAVSFISVTFVSTYTVFESVYLDNPNSSRTFI